jgi:hypothetical protein
MSAAWRVQGNEWISIGDQRVDRQFTDVVVVGGRAIAVGSEAGTPAIFETAADGDDTRWATLWKSDSTAPGELAAVVVTSTAVTAVGWVADERGRSAIVATRAGDATWSAATVEEHAWLTSIAGDGAGQIAAGQQDDGTAAVWRPQPDGSWTPERLPSGDARRSFASGIAMAADRMIVVGQVDNHPASWLYEHGSWTSVELPSATAGERVTAIDATNDGVFLAGGTAVGLGETISPLAWSTTDGHTWTRVGVTGADYTGIVDVVAIGDRLIAWGNARLHKRLVPEIHDLRGHTLLKR